VALLRQTDATSWCIGALSVEERHMVSNPATLFSDFPRKIDRPRSKVLQTCQFIIDFQQFSSPLRNVFIRKHSRFIAFFAPRAPTAVLIENIVF
jgi:hypothetical protein